MVIDSESPSFFLQFDLLLGYASHDGFLYTGRLSDLNSVKSCMKFVVEFIRTQLKITDQVTSSLEIVVHIVYQRMIVAKFVKNCPKNIKPQFSMRNLPCWTKICRPIYKSCI